MQATEQPDPVVAVETRGQTPDAETARMEGAFRRVLRRYRIGAGAHVRLSAPREPDGPLLAQANTTFRGAPVRIQVTGPSGFIASFAAERLDRQLARLTGEGEARCWPDPARPPLAAVTAERPIVRRKVCRLVVAEPGEAIRAMDAMDYDAHLFVDALSGEEAIVYWAGPLGARLARQRVWVRPDGPAGFTVHPHPAPLLTEREAAARLCRYGLPFLFFADPRRRRGRLIYRRHDGDLAVVLPAE